MSDEQIEEQLRAVEQAGAVSMSQTEAATALGWGLARLRGAVHTGRIQAVHLSGRGSVRIPLAEVERVKNEEKDR